MLSKISTKVLLRTTALGLALIASGPAVAEPPAAGPAAAQEESDKVVFTADTLTYDPESGEIVATGRVTVRHEGYTLVASEVRYNEVTGIGQARGGVRITDDKGNLLSASEADLANALREGFVKNVRLLMADGSRAAARTAERSAGRITVLNSAVYSPCRICEDDPGDRPIWQIKAARVTHDQEKRRLYYKNAYLEVGGLPIAYLPYFSHPAADKERASGFLSPDIRIRRELGVVLGLPYHWAISPSSDATITPIITTNEGLVLAGQYRRHVGFGQFQFDGSITYADRRNDLAEKIGGHEFRGHIFTNGRFSHGENWRSTYVVKWASDDTYLRRYDFTNDDTLTSNYLLEGFFGRSYISAESLFFQGLRVEDVQGLTGYAAPLVDAEYVSKPGRWGEVWKLQADGLALHRTDGLDTRRLALTGGIEVPYTNAIGQVFRLEASLRGDLIDASDTAFPDNPAFGAVDGFETRFLPEVTGSFRWPFARIGANTRQTIEPVVLVTFARKDPDQVLLPNEDSRTFDLSDSNIFDPHRLPGYDLYEGGSRITYGLQWTLLAKNIEAEALFGQTFRFTADPASFPDGTGLDDRRSDYVGRWKLFIARTLTVSHRFRLDRENLDFRRNEIDATIRTKRFRLTTGYFQLDRDLDALGRPDREELRASAEIRIKQYWSLTGHVIRNLTDGNAPISHGGGIKYSDECLELGLAIRRNFTEDRDIQPGTSVLIRIKLKNLG